MKEEEQSTSENRTTSLRASRTKECPKEESANGAPPVYRARLKHVCPELNAINRAGRSILLNKLKLGDEEVAAPKEREMEDPKIIARTGNRAIEQHARMRRRPDTSFKGAEIDGRTRDLLQRLETSENLVKKLQSEVLMMKDQLEKMHAHNVQLEAQKQQLAMNLSVAQAKISAYEKHDQVAMARQEQEHKQSEFKDVRIAIANKLENLRSKKEVTKGDRIFQVQSLTVDPRARAPEVKTNFPVSQPIPPPPPANTCPAPPSPPANTCPPPPPPPPPPRLSPNGTNVMQKPTALVELYHSLTKQNGKKGPLGNGNSSSPIAANAHNSIVGEIQNRSAHLLAIKTDVETKGDFIKSLIEKVHSAAYADIEDVLAFVSWLDRELSTLADERAVLKHFNWPERKADALREAAFEYRDLKRLAIEVASVEDDGSISCEAILKKITSLLDKSERSIQWLIKLRDTTMLSYKENNIPVDWMHDSGIVRKIKIASMKLAGVYIKRVLTELRSSRHPERESAHEALVLQGVRFAYRAYQFAGGLDSETMCAFEELRKRAVLSTGKSSRDQIPGITLS